MLCIEEIFFGVPCGRASARLLRAVVKRHVLRKTFGLRIFWRTRQKKFHEWNVGRADRGATARRVFFCRWRSQRSRRVTSCDENFLHFRRAHRHVTNGRRKKNSARSPDLFPRAWIYFSRARPGVWDVICQRHRWMSFFLSKKKIHRDMFTIRRRREATSCEKRRICIAAVCCCTVRTSTSFTCRRESYSTIRRDR